MNINNFISGSGFGVGFGGVLIFGFPFWVLLLGVNIGILFMILEFIEERRKAE